MHENNIKLVLPENAKAWQCDWKNCGFCCITERTEYHETDKKCSKLNIRTKECKIYDKRLLDCKIYPYMIIVTNNGINLSPSLNCPYVLDSSNLDEVDILDILADEDISKSIVNFAKLYRNSLSTMNTKNQNAEDKKIVQLNEKMASLKLIKNVGDIKNFVVDIHDKRSKKIKDFIISTGDFDVSEFVKLPGVSGKYIQPNSTINEKSNPAIMNFHLTKKDHVIFKSRHYTKNIRNLTNPINLMFDDSAHNLLEEYIQLNIDRQLDFISLRVARFKNNYIDSASAYTLVWLSILTYLYGYLTLLALRDDTTIIDYSIMREALSLTDSHLHSIILTKPNTL